jgi:cleavage and polyadenylation specificity factor subunit 1
MQCYTELAPPTAVSHALQLPFLSSKANNLVIAKNSLLQIFEIKSTITEVSADGDGTVDNLGTDLDAEDVPLQRTEHTAKLVLIAEFPLAGTVISLARIKAINTKTRAEALLVAFRDAKLSLVEWDAEAFNLNTISIHYYENPDLAGAPWAADLKDTYNFLTVDPRSRCAALKFGVHNLAILPFRQRDLAEDDYDSDLDGPKGDKSNGVDGTEGQVTEHTPYSSSFVLPLTSLDPTLTHPVHLAFLHEYREPTFGIVASNKEATPSLLAERRDILTYTVFTLDLEQKASTTLLSVPGLPYDIFRVVPLPLPIGGALLLGSNEVIHVDQAGKTNGVAVNEFAKTCTSFALSDQSDLALHLEGCAVELLSQDTGDVLIVLNDGKLVTLTFTLDGRTVSGVTLQPVAADHGGHILNLRASCTANLGRGRVFVGSEDADSVILGWSSILDQFGKKRSQGGVAAGDGDSSMDEDEDIDDMDDDLYNDTAPAAKKITDVAATPSAPGSYAFRIHDTLPSLAPIRDVVIRPSSDARRIPTAKYANIAGDLLLSTGRGSAGAVSVLNRELEPTSLAKSTLGSARALWAVHAKKQAPTGLVTGIGQDAEANMSSNVDYDQYLVVCKAGSNGTEDTVVYEVTGNDIEPTDKGDFEREEASTMNVGTLAGGSKIVQILRSEVKTYDSGKQLSSTILCSATSVANHCLIELNLDQIIPMEDEETGEELRVISANFADPYLLIHREDSSVKLFKTSSTGEVEEVECDALSSTKWLSVSLYKSPLVSDIFVLLLEPEGGLHVSTRCLRRPSRKYSDLSRYLQPPT